MAPTPVVLVYHGGGSNAQVMVRFCGMNRQSDTSGFIAVYPNGTGRLEKVLTFNARVDRNSRWRAHMAGAAAKSPIPRQVHIEHLSQ